MGAGITLWVRQGHEESAQAAAFLRSHGHRADDVRDLAAAPPSPADWARLAKSWGNLWPAVDTRHPRYGELLPRGAEDVDDAGLLALLGFEPGLVKAPLLLTPKGALAGFRERTWAKFLDVGAFLRG